MCAIWVGCLGNGEVSSYMRVDCVIHFLCMESDVCRFRWCRCCGRRMFSWGDRWVTCSFCGFTNRRVKVKRLSSFG